MIRFTLAALCLLSACALLHADEGAQFNVIGFSAEARAEVPNDEIEILMSVTKEARRAADLAALINTDMRWALDLAQKHKSVRSETRQYHTQPRYDKSGSVIGWRGGQTLALTGTDIESASDLATALQERLLIQSMEFRPTDATREQVEDELTVRALARFRERADMIRKSMGAEAYDVLNIQVGQQRPPPRPVYAGARGAVAMEMSADVSTSAGTSDLVVSISGRIQLR